MDKVKVGDIVYEASYITWCNKVIVTEENLEIINKLLNSTYYKDYNKCLDKCHMLHSNYGHWLAYDSAY